MAKATPSRSLAALSALLGLAALAVVEPARGECPRPSADAASVVKEGDALRHVDIGGAIEKYRQAAELDPKNHVIFGKLAKAYITEEHWDDANLILTRACVLAPTWASYFALRGWVLQRAAARESASSGALWKESRATLEHALTLDPGLADAHFDLAEALLREGNTQAALDHYTKAITLAPDQSMFWATLADLYLRLGYYDHAHRTLEEALVFITRDADRFALLMLHGLVLERRRDPPAALTRYEEAAHACGPCNEKGQQVVYFALGAAYARAHRMTEAVNKLQTFLKTVCRGSAAQRYVDECTQAQELLRAMPQP
jgi:tetratricopeptide (TPR) repeat protein